MQRGTPPCAGFPGNDDHGSRARPYSSVKPLNCEATLEGDTVILSRIEPYGFAAFEVCE